MSSLSSILLLNPKKLVLENFHLLCYILSYVQSPLTCKMVNYLLSINKYYNTLINKLLSHHSFSNIFPVSLWIWSEYITRNVRNYDGICSAISGNNTNINNISTRASIHNDIHYNYMNHSRLLKGINMIKWSDYVREPIRSYKKLLDSIVSSSLTDSSTSSMSSNRISYLNELKILTSCQKVIIYTLENIHQTKIKHLFIDCDRLYSRIKNPSINLSSTSNNMLQSFIIHGASLYKESFTVNSDDYVIHYLLKTRFNKLNSLELSNVFINGDKIIHFSRMPMLTSLIIDSCSWNNCQLIFDDKCNINIRNLILIKSHNDEICAYNDICINTNSNCKNSDITSSMNFPNLTLLQLGNSSLRVMDYPLDINKGFFINMKLLKTLILDSFQNSINGLFDSLTSFTHLEMFEYTYHYKNEEVLPPLPNLTYVEVPHNQKVKVPLLQNLSNLNNLNICVSYGDCALGIEKNLINLTSLCISHGHNFDEKSILENIAIYASLTSLTFKFIDINISSMNPLSSLINLTVLSFYGCKLNGVRLAHIKNLQKLSVMECKGKDYTVLDLKYLIQNCVKLKHLILSSTPLNHSLFTLKQLETIKFHGSHKDFSLEGELIHNTKLKSIIFDRDSEYDEYLNQSLDTLINLKHLHLPYEYFQPLPLLSHNTSIYVGYYFPQEFLNDHPIDKIFYYE